MRVLIFLLLFFSTAVQAQFTVTGVIKDSNTGSPLPFATISTSQGITVGDLDGKFIIETGTQLTSFTVSYTGYNPQDITVTNSKNFYTVLLTPATNVLQEVVIDRGNPANGIIKKAISLKQGNDPQRKLNSFKYKTYNRLIITANPDSISGKLDSVFAYEKAGRRLKEIDSANFKFKKLIEKQHLYQTEKVSEYSYNQKDGLKENVLATRMAGFKQPLYEFIGLNLQSYSVYDDIELIETKYAGPLDNDAFNEYRYKILDTVSIDNRKAYMIYFTPKKQHKKKAHGWGNIY